MKFLLRFFAIKQILLSCYQTNRSYLIIFIQIRWSIRWSYYYNLVFILNLIKSEFKLLSFLCLNILAEYMASLFILHL